MNERIVRTRSSETLNGCPFSIFSNMCLPQTSAARNDDNRFTKTQSLQYRPGAGVGDQEVGHPRLVYNW